MNQQIWSKITTVALTTILGTSVSLAGSSHKVIASNNSEINPVVVEQNTETTTEATNPTQSKTNNREENSLATIYSHRWKGRLVATLRVRNIPVLTFLGSTKNATNIKELAGDKDRDPVLRAKAVASRLNQLSQDSFDSRNLKVSWDENSQSYRIKANEEVLVSLNENTILSDSTNNLTRDALQATNRLRRLLGNAPPLTKIANVKPAKDKLDDSDGEGVKRTKKGVASWYGPGFHGKRTASGERFNSRGFTAAHRTLPFGTKVRVTNLRNGRSVIVRINDRGPFSRGRVIDLSAGAARAIGVSGTARVKIEVLGI